MERLEQAFKQKLAQNSSETDRWRKYKEQQQAAISNMKLFRDKLSVDVMVPIGSKAFMPGYLYHTNEIFVSHPCGVFSQCTSQQAQEMARHRIKSAESRLESLEMERDMFQQKLDKPHSDGVFPKGEEREIIEEYDEEKEKAWMIEHKQRIREEKFKHPHSEIDINAKKSHEDVMALLENLEIMEELEHDLDKLQIKDDDMLEKLMSGQIKPPDEKKRISHYSEADIVIGKAAASDEYAAADKPAVSDQIVENLETFKAKDKQPDVDLTNNNVTSNLEDYESDDDTASTSTEDIPIPVLQIEAEAKHLSVAEKIKFFKKKLKEVEKQLQEIQVKSVDDIDEKISKMEVREYLCDYIELLQDELENEMKIQSDETNNPNSVPLDTQKKKRITFSDKDEVQLIHKNQAANTVTRSKIELSDDSYKALHLKPPNVDSDKLTNSNLPEISLPSEADKKKEILDKVEKSFEYISENQSQQDFNLIDKIIDSAESKCRTLYIHFKHSDASFKNPGYGYTEDQYEEKTIGSPADIYDAFKDYFPPEVRNKHLGIMACKADESIENTNCSTVDAVNHEKIDWKSDEPAKNLKAFLDRQTLAIKNEHTVKIENELVPPKINEPVRSILRNKEKVQEEKITTNTKNVRSGQTKPSLEIRESGFDLIMGEVVERKKATDATIEKNTWSKDKAENKDEPDPLPSDRFVDVHAPKKRISRFKQMRAHR